MVPITHLTRKRDNCIDYMVNYHGANMSLEAPEESYRLDPIEELPEDKYPPAY